MSTTSNRLRYLLDAYADKNCTPQEMQELNRLLEDDWSRIQLGQPVPHIDWESMYGEITGAPVVKLNEQKTKRPFYRVAVAAAITIMLGAGGYFMLLNKPGKQTENVKTRELPNDVKAPETNKAMITLADGRTVALDSVASGTLAFQGKVRVMKNANGEIVYSSESEVGPSTSSGKEVLYNTLFNPRGSKVTSITLVDGTKVWLNAESSLKYFTGVGSGERKVEITGEAFFEVSKDAARKFIVTGNGVTTEVLGTHFNVNTYTDESSIKVTLLEGSVKVIKGALSGLLKPGQQAQIASDIKVLTNVDLEAVVAWKNGYFKFKGTDIQTMMRQAERWYDIQVKYPDGIPSDKFGGVLSMNVNLSQFLKILEYSDVNAKIEGRTVTIRP